MRWDPVARAFAATVVTALLTMSGCAAAVTEHTDDATITTRVKTALLNDRTVNGSTIDVRTANGVVTLSGRVGTVQERERAVAVARGTSGVADVRSTLQIDTSGG